MKKHEIPLHPSILTISFSYEMSKENKQQQLTEKKQVKKCRGNRRLQRFNRKCRSKGMNNQTIQMLLKQHPTTGLIHQDHQQKHEEEEEMDNSSIMNKQSHITNISILFENQVQ